MHIVVDLPDIQLRELTQLGNSCNRSRASLVREAVAIFLAARKHGDRAFGLWGANGADGVANARTIRAEWE